MEVYVGLVITARERDRNPLSVVVVLFGATGDLAHRMVMPALVELHERGLLPQRWRLIGCATDRWDDEAFRARLRTPC